MKKFEYRAPRFAVDLPARLTIKDLTVSARCREISKDGMTLELLQPLPPNSLGTVSVSYKDWTIGLQARVAHVGATQCGLEFIYESEAERKVVAHFVASLASVQSRPGPVRLS